MEARDQHSDGDDLSGEYINGAALGMTRGNKRYRGQMLFATTGSTAVMAQRRG
jgi:hypothetical protein